MNQNLQALSERGEKLQQLSDKTQDMENASANFLSNVKELVASQQKKSKSPRNYCAFLTRFD
jgi:hypothetical protein